jgi:translocator protein
LLKALQRLLSRKDIDEKKNLLILQAIIWIIFFSYGYIYFNKKSTLLAALWTVGDAALAASSFAVSRKEDKNLSLLYLPLLGWTSFASTIAIYQALRNYDPLLNFSPKITWKQVKASLHSSFYQR